MARRQRVCVRCRVAGRAKEGSVVAAVHRSRCHLAELAQASANVPARDGVAVKGGITALAQVCVVRGAVESRRITANATRGAGHNAGAIAAVGSLPRTPLQETAARATRVWLGTTTNYCR